MKYFFVIWVICSVVTLKVNSQCNPTVIFKEDFGTGTNNYGTALGNSITAYTFDPTGSLADGEYSIRKTAAPLDGSQIYPTWYTGYDHTGNGGYMMVINASYQAGKFYETRIDNLCSGTSIKFSAWIANLLKLGSPDPLDPDVKFEIKSAVSGTVLGSYTTGTISRYTAFTWEQYGFNILLPPGETSVILTMYNNQVGGGGNDLVLDDIEFSICGAETKPFLSGTYMGGNTVCSNSNITINGNITKQVYNTPVYQWQFSTDSVNWSNIPGATQPDYVLNNAQPADSKWYRLLVAEPASINSPNCRTTSAPVKIEVYDPKPASISNEGPYCVGDTIKLTNQFNALNYQWSGPNNFTSTDDRIAIFPATLNEAGIYNLQTTTAGGCITNGATNVIVKENKLSVDLPDGEILLCNGATTKFIADNPNITNWQWNTGSQTSEITVSDAGEYWVVVSDDACKAADTAYVKTNRTPAVNLGKDSTICFGEELKLTATDPVAETYLWQDSSTDSVRIVNSTGYYEVTISNECGTASDGVAVTVDENCANQLFVPTAFTPNNDNKNDILRARAFFPITNFYFQIYNRWGQQVFFTNDITIGWDGNFGGVKASSGTYVWRLGYKRKGIPYEQKGVTVLIR